MSKLKKALEKAHENRGFGGQSAHKRGHKTG